MPVGVLLAGRHFRALAALFEVLDAQQASGSSGWKGVSDDVVELGRRGYFRQLWSACRIATRH